MSRAHATTRKTALAALPDFRDLLRAFSDAEVRFLVVGPYAVAAHAEPRATTAWPGRLAVRYGEVPCFVIGRDALIENERRLGRARDLADLELLERHRREE